MKKIFILLFSIIFCLLIFLCGCDNTRLRTYDNEINEKYAFVSGLQDDAFVYDKETKICYLMIRKQITADKFEYAFIMLYDKNGEPLLWQEN